MKAVKHKGIVGKKGKIEIDCSDLNEGTAVEIIILIPDEIDATEYLLSTEANRQELLEAIERVEAREDLVTITSEQWHEKYRF